MTSRTATRACGRARGWRRRDRGQATVELALVLPVVVLLLLAVIQVALVARDQLATVHAARVAVRAASVEPNVARVNAAVSRALPGAHLEIGPRPAVGGMLEIEVVYRSITGLPLIGPLMPDPEFHVRATMRVER